MSDQFYYLDAENQQIGPVSRAVLEQLHRAGALTDDTLVAGEAESEWIPFRDLRSVREQGSSLPPVPVAKEKAKATRRPKRKEKESIGWRTVAVVFGIIALFVALPYLLTLSDDPSLYAKVSLHNPEETPLTDIASAIESMPQAHHRMPAPSGVNEGVMLLFTGENSVQVRAIPDHSGLYQIDLTQYGVIYDHVPAKPITRTALTLLLTLGTEFKNHRWHLIEARGGSIRQVTTPGQSNPDEQTNESIPLEEAMWHGQWVVDFLNGESQHSSTEKRNATAFQSLEESFLQ